MLSYSASGLAPVSHDSGANLRFAKFYDKGLDAIKKVGSDVVEMNYTDDETELQENNGSIIVTGVISYSDVSTADRQIVKVFKSDLRTSQQMGSAVTDSSGTYSISFDANSPTNIVVKVYDNGQQMASAGPVYNVTESTVVDITIFKTKSATNKKSKVKKIIAAVY